MNILKLLNDIYVQKPVSVVVLVYKNGHEKFNKLKLF